MVKRPGCRQSGQRGARHARYPIARMGGELSAVINRVRQAFGALPMRESASCTEIRAVERLVDRTARRCLRGEAGLSDWYRVLRQYEETWLRHLDELRRRAAERPAA